MDVYEIESTYLVENSANGVHLSDLSQSALVRLIYQTALDSNTSQQLRLAILEEYREDKPSVFLTSSLLNHLKRALRMAKANSAIEHERQQLSKVVLDFTPPYLSIDKNFMVLSMNEAAKSLFSLHAFSSEKLFIKNGQLCCYKTDLLSKFMIRAKQSGAAFQSILDSTESDISLRLSMACSEENDQIFHVLIFDQENEFTHSLDEIVKQYKLTLKEREVLRALTEACDIPTIASKLTITVQTVYQHLKQIFKKVGVTSQNALLNQVLQYLLVHFNGTHPQKNQIAYVNGLTYTHFFKLKDGRTISYIEMGDRHGKAVLYFHSINASRLEILIHQKVCLELGVRLICIDRAGYGFSNYVDRENYGQYVQDIAALLDHLSLTKVALLSCSAGAPHALSVAELLPNRVSKVHCASAVPSPEFVFNSNCKSAINDTLNNFFRVAPVLLRPAIELTLMGQTADSLLKQIGTGSRRDIFTYSDLDVRYIQSPEVFPYFVVSMTESLRQGPKAWANENVMCNKDWAINLEQIQAPVTFWHGTHDTLIPLEMVEPFTHALPNGRLNVLEGESHLLVFRYLETILREILNGGETHQNASDVNEKSTCNI